MRVIGITGGVGAGKTRILHYLKRRYRCRILLADDAAKMLQEPGQPCYEQIVSLLGKDIAGKDGRIRKEKMAEKIFHDGGLLAAVNAIVHPAVKTYILQEIERERRKAETDFFFLEAALLLECGYEEIAEEIWYVYADEDVRRRRLKAGRKYTDEKIDSIFRSQLPDRTYRERCGFVIDNSGEAGYAYEQIDKKMGESLWKK
ncbi:dephospho-CoA kinase [Lachnospiraceae bacterium JLR.KK008]